MESRCNVSVDNSVFLLSFHRHGSWKAHMHSQVEVAQTKLIQNFNILH